MHISQGRQISDSGAFARKGVGFFLSRGCARRGMNGYAWDRETLPLTQMLRFCLLLSTDLEVLEKKLSNILVQEWSPDLTRLCNINMRICQLVNHLPRYPPHRTSSVQRKFPALDKVRAASTPSVEKEIICSVSSSTAVIQAKDELVASRLDTGMTGK